MIGSGNLAQTLMAAGLVDEFRLMIYPLVLGSGKRLFAEPGRIPLRLVDSMTTEKGVLIATYEPAENDQ